MEKYICKACKKPCKITVAGDSCAPKCCPYSMIWKAVNWHKAAENLQPDLQDKQDKLQDKPLPDWCKVGEWIYYTTPDGFKKAYGQISAIEKHETGAFTLFIKRHNHRVSYDSKNISQAIARTWSFEEAPYQLKVKRKDWSRASEELAFLSGRSGKWGYLVGAEDSECLIFYSLEEMKNRYRTLDNTPCGVLEHLENGTWVK